jgi:hypothetical protein
MPILIGIAALAIALAVLLVRRRRGGGGADGFQTPVEPDPNPFTVLLPSDQSTGRAIPIPKPATLTADGCIVTDTLSSISKTLLNPITGSYSVVDLDTNTEVWNSSFNSVSTSTTIKNYVLFVSPPLTITLPTMGSQGMPVLFSGIRPPNGYVKRMSPTSYINALSGTSVIEAIGLRMNIDMTYFNGSIDTTIVSSIIDPVTNTNIWSPVSSTVPSGFKDVIILAAGGKIYYDISDVTYMKNNSKSSPDPVIQLQYPVSWSTNGYADATKVTYTPLTYVPYGTPTPTPVAVAAAAPAGESEPPPSESSPWTTVAIVSGVLVGVGLISYGLLTMGGTSAAAAIPKVPNQRSPNAPKTV